MTSIVIILGQHSDSWANAQMESYASLPDIEREKARIAVLGHFHAGALDNAPVRTRLLDLAKNKARWYLEVVVRVAEIYATDNLLEVLAELAALGHNVEVLRHPSARLAA